MGENIFGGISLKNTDRMFTGLLPGTVELEGL